MIAQLRGDIIEKNPTYVIVDYGGVGYFVKISLHSFSQIKDDKKIRLGGG